MRLPDGKRISNARLKPKGDISGEASRNAWRAHEKDFEIEPRVCHPLYPYHLFPNIPYSQVVS